MKPLSRKTVNWWRSASESQEFLDGIMYLRVNASSSLGGSTEGDLLKSALAFTGYQKALSDIEDKLTFIPQREKSSEEQPLTM